MEMGCKDMNWGELSQNHLLVVNYALGMLVQFVMVLNGFYLLEG
jgi:hypothetical protein